MDTISIEAVTGCVGSWYIQYCRLRHRVFVVEQGWEGLSSPYGDATIPDPADRQARFWLARSTSGTLVGAVRVRAVGDAFPHEELFSHHLARPEIAAMRPWMGTLNSLVVDREWRGRPFMDANGCNGSVGRALLRASLSGSASAGVRALVATAQTIISARALIRAGFCVIDPPVRTHLHTEFPMCNVGLVLDRKDSCARALSTYFVDCQTRVLSAASLDDWFSAPLESEAGLSVGGSVGTVADVLDDLSNTGG